MSIVKLLFNKTLNNVLFGVGLMCLIAAYIAIGSGIPEVREYFEMNELEFFSTLLLKILMAVLVINLITVSWTRIPLTPPRYGVWCIHLGIITLILGMGGYYANKIEGVVRIPLGGTVDHFYDNAERALYVRINGQWIDTVPLPDLPRFNEYSQAKGNVGALDLPTLRNIQPDVTLSGADTSAQKHLSLKEAYGLKEPLSIDVVGFWPYAFVNTSFSTAADSTDVGLRIGMDDPHSGKPRETWLISGDARFKSRPIADGAIEAEHRHETDANIAQGLQNAASQLLQLTYSMDDKTKGDTFVQVGKSYPLGDSGYTIKVENYNPAWPKFGTHEVVKALVVHVKSPTSEFRRMLLEGDTLQTDFKLDVAGAGPMGKRQTEPLDKSLVLGFAVTDPFRLMPIAAPVKHTFITTGDKKLIDIEVAIDEPAKITEWPEGRGTIETTIDEQPRGPFQPPPAPGDDSHVHAVKLNVARVDKVVKSEEILPIPVAQRQREIGMGGDAQVIQAKLTSGSWSRTVFVPYTPQAGENPDWTSAVVKLPQGDVAVQLALCHNRLRLPARLTLENFELVPYPGGDATMRGAMIRDFRSTLIVENPVTHESATEVAHMNNPVYYDGGRWLFFQAAYDGDARQWTMLGIGNRPGVWIMTTGCAMIFVGLMYAFYLKPVVIRRMKSRALAAAAARKIELSDSLETNPA
jgi:hypothetical protein